MLAMKDVFLLLLIGIWLVVAIKRVKKARKSGRCIGCHSDCASCGQGRLYKKREQQKEK